MQTVTIPISEWIELKRKATAWDNQKTMLDEYLNKNNHGYGGKIKYVYVITDQHWNMKVGVSNNPQQRKLQLQTATPDKLYLRGWVVGDEQLEREIHNKLEKHRIKGEWFKFNGEAKKVLKSMGFEIR